MDKTFATDTLIRATYEHFFDLLMKCLLVSVGLLLVAEFVLIGLCCWQTVREGRRKKQEPPGRSYPRLYDLHRRSQGIQEPTRQASSHVAAGVRRLTC